MAFMYFTEVTSNKNRGQTPPTPLIKEKTNHHPGAPFNRSFVEENGGRTGRNGRGQGTTAQWRRKWNMANTTKYKLLSIADQAQDQRRTIRRRSLTLREFASLLETQRTRRATYKTRRT